MLMQRIQYQKEVIQNFQIHTVTALLGARQCGKTTFSKQFANTWRDGEVHFFDLENPIDLYRLENAVTTLSPLHGLIIIDEIQRAPELFSTLRYLVDQYGHQQKYLILGSASRELIRQSSESLAGRIGYIEMHPFCLQETNNLQKLLLRGGFPLSFLADTDTNSMNWRHSYIKTFLEQDIPNLGFRIPMKNIYRFWMMLCHYHGQSFNASEIGRSLQLSDHTVKSYLDILEGTFMVRALQPWFKNISKRQVKTPKIYFRDSGILNALMRISSMTELQEHPKLGAIWEGFALEETLQYFNIPSNEAFFWATHADAELDLMFMHNSKLIGVEFKYADVPKVTKSMQIALNDLKLDKLLIIYPGNKRFEISDKISVLPLNVLETPGIVF